MTTKPDLSPESIQRMLEIVDNASTCHFPGYALPTSFTEEFPPPTVRALLEEIVRLREQGESRDEWIERRGWRQDPPEET